MSHQDRLDEVRDILAGLVRLEDDLRGAAARALGQVEQNVFVGLNAQMALINTLEQTLGSRAEMLEAAIRQEGPAPGKRPKLVKEGEGDGPKPAA
jgi:hypothetical protein